MTVLQKAILSTVCYADIFDYPLTEREIWRFLIGKTTRLSKFREALKVLVKNKSLFQKENFYYKKGRAILASKRKERAKVAINKIRVANRISRFLAYIPTVRLVGLSGALSMNNAPKEDDIDLFIITSPGTMWTTRLLCVFLLDVFRLRRKPGEIHFNNKICLNMLMEYPLLSLPRNERDLYSAHEVAQLKPLINKSRTYELFLQKNKWAKKYLPHAFTLPKLNTSNAVEWWSRGFQAVEVLSKKLQLWYMQKRRTNEVINNGILKFHPQDARKKTLAEYQKRLIQFH